MSRIDLVSFSDTCNKPHWYEIHIQMVVGVEYITPEVINLNKNTMNQLIHAMFDLKLV